MVEPDQLLKLYELAMQDAHHFSRLHHDKVVFYSGLFSSVIALAAASLAVDIPGGHLGLQLLGLSILFFVMTVVGIFALDATGRAHRRYFEAVSVRSKIEQALGMTDAQESADTRPYWRTEPLAASSLVASRSRFNSSAEFIDDRVHNGSTGKAVRGLFFTLTLLSLMLGVALGTFGVLVLLRTGA